MNACMKGTNGLEEAEWAGMGLRDRGAGLHMIRSNRFVERRREKMRGFSPGRVLGWGKMRSSVLVCKV